MSRSHESLVDTRSKSKSPRRSRRDRENTSPEPPLPPPATQPDQPHSSSSLSANYPNIPSKGKSASRRPHTSAGPRDKSSFTFSGSSRNAPYVRTHDLSSSSSHQRSSPVQVDDSTPYRRKVRPGTASTIEVTKSNAVGHVFSPVSSIRSTGSNSSGRRSSILSSSTTSVSAEDSIREWEEELARIEMKSRRSSDLLGFSFKRKKRNNDPGGSSVPPTPTLLRA